MLTTRAWRARTGQPATRDNDAGVREWTWREVPFGDLRTSWGSAAGGQHHRTRTQTGRRGGPVAETGQEVLETLRAQRFCPGGDRESPLAIVRHRLLLAR